MALLPKDKQDLIVTLRFALIMSDNPTVEHLQELLRQAEYLEICHTLLSKPLTIQTDKSFTSKDSGGCNRRDSPAVVRSDTPESSSGSDNGPDTMDTPNRHRQAKKK
ncbi:MAG: hypothetical protein M1834_008497 [Cirrosporium novae-zelandiae]|nr:MAG: hypothetical protein M1834_008497 [Cirrosporium novae-zelandiae]